MLRRSKFNQVFKVNEWSGVEPSGGLVLVTNEDEDENTNEARMGLDPRSRGQ